MKNIGRKLLILELCCVLCHYLCVASVDYCAIEDEKCVFPIRKPHIGCNKTEITFEVNPECSNIKLIKLSNKTKNYIIKLHNELRDKLASGNIEKYPPASRMLQMYWDNELEATACLHAQHCVMDHDKCRATPSYDHPGQNLAQSSYSSLPQTNITKEWHNAIVSYFNEYQDVSPNIIDEYVPRQPEEKMYGHFTVMSKDNNDRIGCCHITYENDLYKNDKEVMYGHLMTCNYRETNVIGRRTYNKGKPTTACKDFGVDYKSSDTYKHLCSNPKEHFKLSLKEENEPVENDESPKDFCELAKIKCGRNKHVACEKDSGFSVNPACKKIQVHNMNTEYKDLLVKEHNSYRDLVASGNQQNFPSASKMLEMEWDPMLEQVACAHVQYCQQHHAKCLVTNRDGLPGQSLYVIHKSIPEKNHSIILRQALEKWFNESLTTSSSIIDNYKNVGSFAGNFGFMMKEDQMKLGCCFITFEELKNDFNWHGHLVTCLYEYTLYLNSQIYTRGKSTSKCNEYGNEYSTSVTYQNLCSKKNSASIVRVHIVFFLSLLFTVFYNKYQ